MVRDNLRHASVQTTERYLHVEPDRQHTQTQKHRLRGGVTGASRAMGEFCRGKGQALLSRNEAQKEGAMSWW